LQPRPEHQKVPQSLVSLGQAAITKIHNRVPNYVFWFH
jgi:hypothetical protein